MSTEMQDIDRVRRWVDEHCHQSHVRHMLHRAVEYLQSVERAGLNVDTTSGDELYEFLTDPANSDARVRTFVEPTL